MKKIFSVFLISCIINSASAGGFLFPNFDYEYSSIYLFNTDFNSEKRVDQRIYAGDFYALSKIGDGITLSKEQNERLTKIFIKGADELRSGMSKCFLPRHGIIYFNKYNKPVGSISICFECEKIVFWSSNGLPDYDSDYSKYNYDKADKQLKKLENLVKEIGLPVYENQNNYKLFRDTSVLFQQSTWVQFNDPSLDSLYFRAYTIDSVKSWNLNPEYFILNEEISVEISDGGKEYRFAELYDKDGSQFQFNGDDNNAHLIYGSIKTPFLKLPNGVVIGMSLSEVMNIITPVYNGPSNPSELIIKGQFVKTTYRFEYLTLKQVVLEYNQ